MAMSTPVVLPDSPLPACFVDRSPWVYWDVIKVRGGRSLPEFLTGFKFAIGELDPFTHKRKTKHDTNLITSGYRYGLGATRCLILEELAVYFPSWMPDVMIDQILSSALLEFCIAEKIFFEHRFDLEQVRELRKGSTVERNVYSDGTEETFDHLEFSDRVVRVTSARPGCQKYIAPMVPFHFSIRFHNPPVLDFKGVRPILVPVMRGLCDRAVQ